jgi:hypothetical protein
MNETLDGLLIAETDLSLGGMDVDIHLVGLKFQEQEGDGVAASQEQAAAGILDSLEESAVADPAAIQEEILPLAVAP